MDPEVTTSKEPSTIQAKIAEFIESIVVFAAIFIVIWLFVAQPHKVSGSSMHPTLVSGDYILTNKLSYRVFEPKRGEIIVFKNPKGTEDFIKRIMGSAGDRVKIAGGKVFINGDQLQEEYLDSTVNTNAIGGFMREGEEVEIPKGEYLVFGDNRVASSDSREWGFITTDEIIGKAFFRYWPLREIGLIKSASF